MLLVPQAILCMFAMIADIKNCCIRRSGIANPGIGTSEGYSRCGYKQWWLVEVFTGGGQSFEELGVVRDSCGSHTQKWY